MFAALLSSCTSTDSSQQAGNLTAIIDVPRSSSHILVPLAFDGSRSFDPNGSITRFEWDFGNGQTAEGEIVNHTYSETGQYEVTLEGGLL